MKRIDDDAFYEYIRKYDTDSEVHLVGAVDYHLLRDNKPYAGVRSHREALLRVFEYLAKERTENKENAGSLFGDGLADRMQPLSYDIHKARSSPVAPEVFFYCPDIVSTDYYGNRRYDAGWEPDNSGTAVPYWYALMEPVYGKRNGPEDFRKVNGALFPNGTEELDIYEWTTDWSDYFDDGHEWYGACCWSVYDKTQDRYAVMLVSATD